MVPNQIANGIDALNLNHKNPELINGIIVFWRFIYVSSSLERLLQYSEQYWTWTYDAADAVAFDVSPSTAVYAGSAASPSSLAALIFHKDDPLLIYLFPQIPQIVFQNSLS